MTTMLSLLLALAVLAANTEAKNDYQDLYDSVMTGYNKEVAPMRTANESVKVQFGVAGLCFDLTRDGVLNGRTWLRLKYNDPRLAYDPAAFGNIQVFRIDPSLIWTPDVILYNRFDARRAMFPLKQMGEGSNALIYPTGDVLIVPDIHLDAICDGVDLDDPWAEHSCTLKFGSWTFDGYTMDLQFYADEKKIDTTDYYKECPMQVTHNSAKRVEKIYDCCPEPYVSLEYKLGFQKRYLVNEYGITRNPRLKKVAKTAPVDAAHHDHDDALVGHDNEI